MERRRLAFAGVLVVPKTCSTAIHLGDLIFGRERVAVTARTFIRQVARVVVRQTRDGCGQSICKDAQ